MAILLPGCRPVLSALHRLKTARLQRWRITHGAFTACNFILKSRTPSRATHCSRASRWTSAARAHWVMDDYLNQAIERIRQQVGDERVILGLSGGVDSSVAAALLQRAIGEQLTCVFVDHGLLRLNEAAHVRHAMAALGVKIEYVDASAEFIARLAGVTDPEQKRQIIGAQFIEVFQREA